VSETFDIYQYDPSVKVPKQSHLILSYVIVLYNNVSFITPLPKMTSPQRSEPCPHWKDCQGATAAATHAWCQTGQPCKRES